MVFSSLLCSVYTILIGANTINYSTQPKGSICAIDSKHDIKFLLYTSQNPSKPEYLYLKDTKVLSKSNFNFTQDLAIYVHGFTEIPTVAKQSSQEIKNAFLERGNYNVILIDWSTLAAAPWYISAVHNLPIVGKYVARFIYFLERQGYQVSKIHLIGFSLGAELVGSVGKQLKKKGIILSRITGLDPAWPLFHKGSPHRQLSYKVADFVDVIHTDAGIFGNPQALGHADFYPNGGVAQQPGCVRLQLAKDRLINIILGCSHRRAWQYFVETIRRPFAFKVGKCKPSKAFARCSYEANGSAFMGMGADKGLRGKFYLKTNRKSPFGRNNY